MTRGCSATPSWRRPRSTPASRSTRSATSRARWSGWASTSRADPRPPDRRRMARPRLEVADVFRAHGAAWRKANAGHLSLAQLKVMSAIETCRTSALGGHVERCEDCAHERIAPTIPAATVTARSVRARRRGNGSQSARQSFCRFPIITSSSPCRRRSARSRSTTRPSSTICCSRPQPRR
jgi:Transposase zinc-binding domain